MPTISRRRSVGRRRAGVWLSWLGDPSSAVYVSDYFCRNRECTTGRSALVNDLVSHTAGM